jgi:hypothetical protein
VVYDRAMVAEAARRFCLRSIGWRGFGAFAVTLAALLSLVAGGDRSWLVGAIGAVLGLAVLFGLAMFVVPYRRSLARFEALADGAAELGFDEDGFLTRSALGEQRFDWRWVERVWTYPRFWMVFLRGSNYMLIPTAGLDDVTSAFVRERVEASGGRID